MNSISEMKMALITKKSVIEEGITLLEEDQKTRAKKIEEILQEELAKTVQSLHNSDMEIVRSLSDSGFGSIKRLNDLMAEIEDLELCEESENSNLKKNETRKLRKQDEENKNCRKSRYGCSTQLTQVKF